MLIFGGAGSEGRHYKHRRGDGLSRRTIGRGCFEDVDKKFDDMDEKFEDNFRDVRSRLDRLAADHHGLARELSELRGELRGRLGERSRPASG